MLIKKPGTIALALAAVLLAAVFAVGCGFTGAQDEIGGEPVFSARDDVVAVTLHSSGSGDAEADTQYVPELAAWAQSFTCGRPLSDRDTPEPGLNSFSITLTYADGTSESSGIDLTDIDGNIYYVNRDALPDCWHTAWDDGDASSSE